MAESNDRWKDDGDLQVDLRTYVKQNLRRQEILDFVKEKYPNYRWSLRTLCRRLSYFDIKFIDYDTNLGSIEQAVRKEMDGPGRLSGYRALHKKLKGSAWSHGAKKYGLQDDGRSRPIWTGGKRGSWTFKTTSSGKTVYINGKVNLIITICWQRSL